MPSSDYLPEVDDVALFLRTRTRDVNGVELGTFTDDTRPTGDQVEAIIADTLVNVEDDIGDDIDDELWPSAARIVALRAAMAIEVSYFPEQVATDRSVYPQLKEWYEEDLDKLNVAIVETAEGGEVGTDAGQDTPLWGGGDLPLQTVSELFGTDLSGQTAFLGLRGTSRDEVDPAWTTLGTTDDTPSVAPGPGTIAAYLRRIRDVISGVLAVRSIDGTGFVDNSGTDRQVKYAVIDASTNGDNQILAAVTARKIRVHSVYLMSDGVATVRFESGTGGTALSGRMPLVANSGFVLNHNPHGWFETDINTLLNLELSSAVNVDGGLTYSEVV